MMDRIALASVLGTLALLAFLFISMWAIPAFHYFVFGF